MVFLGFDFPFLLPVLMFYFCMLNFDLGILETMAVEVTKVLYIVVVDAEGEGSLEKRRDDAKHSFRYTRSVLQNTLQLMGCKPRHAFKVVFIFIFLIFFLLPLICLGWLLDL